MRTDEKFIQRCIDLAFSGRHQASPNPMVGCVIVHNDQIIGEGYHQKYGEPHAEVNAISSVNDQSVLPESTLYVNLEPCAHFGKTPPCSDLIIAKKIPRVVIGTSDPFSEVSGRGIKKMRDAGTEVKSGILKHSCLELNKTFFEFHKNKRPYVILKWAESADGLIDRNRSPETPVGPNWITGMGAKMLVHKWRSEVQSIMIGTKTALNDNPGLNVREWTGKSPLRIVLDRILTLPQNLKLFDQSIPTYVITEKKDIADKPNTTFIRMNFNDDLIPNLFRFLYQKGIQSLFVEGGACLLQSVIDSGLWNEARVFVGDVFFSEGIQAPKLKTPPTEKIRFDKSSLFIFKNTTTS